jgi:hypothetical protein
MFQHKMKERQSMYRRTLPFAFALILVIAAVVPVLAGPGKPNFTPRLYADGEVWGTKGAAALPPPNGKNDQSFDKLFVITNSNNPAGQLPVAEAAPGNPNYNGGRWYTHTVEWTQAGLNAHDTVPVLTSYAEVMEHKGAGHLEITAGSPPGEDSPPDFFECPLLPVK